jgi:dolichyl-phosphate-mannose--protein O-mannosyl transferase
MALRPNENRGRLLPILIIAASAAALIASVVFMYYGIYFFFFFVPLAFGLPWSIKRLWRQRARKQWNVSDLR